MSIKCTVTTSGTGFTVDISPTDNCTVADGVVTVTDETAEASFSVEFTAASGYSITSIDYNNSSDVNVLDDGNNFAVSFNSYDPGSEPENTLTFTVVTSSNSGSGGDNPDQPSSSIQINISQNGTTTLATAGKLCNKNIDIVTNVPSSGGIPLGEIPVVASLENPTSESPSLVMYNGQIYALINNEEE